MCGNRDDCSSESSYYQPGFKINYNGESSSSSTVRAVNNTGNTRGSVSTLDRETVKERCRVAYVGCGGSYAVEGHGKLK